MPAGALTVPLDVGALAHGAVPARCRSPSRRGAYLSASPGHYASGANAEHARWQRRNVIPVDVADEHGFVCRARAVPTPARRLSPRARARAMRRLRLTGRPTTMGRAPRGRRFPVVGCPFGAERSEQHGRVRFRHREHLRADRAGRSSRQAKQFARESAVPTRRCRRRAPGPNGVHAGRRMRCHDSLTSSLRRQAPPRSGLPRPSCLGRA